MDPATVNKFENYSHDSSNYAPHASHSIAIGNCAGVLETGNIALWMPDPEDPEMTVKYLFRRDGSVWIGYDPRKPEISYLRIKNDLMVNYANMELRKHLCETYPEANFMPPEVWREKLSQTFHSKMDPCTPMVEKLVNWAKERITKGKKQPEKQLSTL